MWCCQNNDIFRNLHKILYKRMKEVFVDFSLSIIGPIVDHSISSNPIRKPKIKQHYVSSEPWSVVSLKWSAKVWRRVIFVDLFHRQVFEFTHRSLDYQSGGSIPSVPDQNYDGMALDHPYTWITYCRQYMTAQL